MPRQIDFAGSSEECSLLLERLKQHPGIARITFQLGTSRDPDGDIATVEAANHSFIDNLNSLIERSYYRNHRSRSGFCQVFQAASAREPCGCAPSGVLRRPPRTRLPILGYSLASFFWSTR